MYLALLGSAQTYDKNTLRKVEANIGAMISLHDEILSGLRSITKECLLPMEGKRVLPKLAKHVRFESMDSVRSKSWGRKSLKFHAFSDHAKGRDAKAEPKEAAAVASMFGKMLGGTASRQMGRFSVYEEYGAKYAEMSQACASASRSLPDWGVFERGIEALVHHVLGREHAHKGDKKGLTLEDLLIKVC